MSRSKMKVACIHCEHEFDPNEEGINWHPPSHPGSASIGAIECPNPDCKKIEDFHEYSLLTQ